jgi:hypothetical protein
MVVMVNLFIYLNNKYVGFFHDVTILHKLNLYKNSHYIYMIIMRTY